LPKCHGTFFPKFLSPIFEFWRVFIGFRTLFWEKFTCYIPRRGGERGTDQCHKMTQGEGARGGLKISQKKCHVLFEWPQSLEFPLQQNMKTLTLSKVELKDDPLVCGFNFDRWSYLIDVTQNSVTFEMYFLRLF
jgi:hypothetical protein